MPNEANHPGNPEGPGNGGLPAEEPEVQETLEIHPKDSFHRIFFGQVEEPLFPPPNPPSETPEDELTRAALNDPAGRIADLRPAAPTLWRFLALVAVVVAALAIIFWRR